MDVSIIIVNYNTKQLTVACIDSIYKHTENLIFEIIVVDNASRKDDKIEDIQTLFPSVKLINSNTNLGFGKANNLGAEHACGTYILLLNSDTLLLNNAIYILYSFFEATKNKIKLGGVGAFLLNEQRELTHSFGNFPKPSQLLLSVLRKYIQRKEPKDLININSLDFFEVEYITGACLLLEKNTFKKLGEFNPKYFMYFEETDLQKRMNAAGFSQWILTEPQIIHLEGKSFKVSNQRRMMFDNSKFIYIKTHHPHYQYIIFRILYFVARLPSIFDTKYTWKERTMYWKLLTNRIK